MKKTVKTVEISHEKRETLIINRRSVMTIPHDVGAYAVEHAGTGTKDLEARKMKRRRLAVIFIALSTALTAVVAARYVAHSKELTPVEFAEAPSQTFSVTSVSNSGAGTLRQAIMDANANPGLDTIAFNLAGSGIRIIDISSVLPTITSPVVIDGTTQPGYAGTPLVFVRANGTSEAMKITAGGSTLKGLTFGNFDGTTADGAILLSTAGSNVVTACTFGVMGDSTIDRNSNQAITIDGISNNTIGGATAAERNYFGGDTFNTGVSIKNGGSGNRIVGNWFGQAPNGTALPMRISVNILASPNNQIGGTTGVTPGGACTGECNVIAGNFDTVGGVNINGNAATGNVIVSNHIGLLANGTTANQNRITGIRITAAPANRIGGSTPAERNVISGNGTTSVLVESAGATGNIITGNYIGTDSTGMNRSTTTGSGIILSTGSTNTTIGGTQGTTWGGACTGVCNVISGNGNNGTANGITIQGSNGNTIDGNYIGLNETGTAAMPNGINPAGTTFQGNAIQLIDSSSNVIGRPISQPRGDEMCSDVSRPDSPATMYCIKDDVTGNFMIISITDITTATAQMCISGALIDLGPILIGRDLQHDIIYAYPDFGHPRSFFAKIELGPRTAHMSWTFGEEHRPFLIDSSIDDNGPCTCAGTGFQYQTGSTELLEQGGNTDLNTVGSSYFNYSVTGTQLNLDIPRPTVTITGNNNVIDDIIASIKNQPVASVQGGAGNTITLNGVNTHVFPQLPLINIAPGTQGGILPPNLILRYDPSYQGPGTGFFLEAPSVPCQPNQPFTFTPYAVDHTLTPFGQTPTIFNKVNDFTIQCPGSGIVDISASINAALLQSLGDSVTATVTNSNGSTSAMGITQYVFRAQLSWDNDHKTDLSVNRPGGNPLVAGSSPSLWYTLNSRDNSIRVTQFGVAEDKLVTGDYYGIGSPQFAVWRPSEGRWYIGRPSATSPGTDFETMQWGIPTDISVPGDYDDDGRNDLAIFRPAEGNWYIRESLSGQLRVRQWGVSTDKLVQADYDGNGQTDLAIYRNGQWWISPCLSCAARVEHFGVSSDIPVPADYDGDGKADLAIWRPSNGQWWISKSTGGMIVYQWGLSTDIPVNGDFDGDGKNDIAIWRPSTGEWWILRSSNGSFYGLQWGQNGDIPVPRFPGQ